MKSFKVHFALGLVLFLLPVVLFTAKANAEDDEYSERARQRAYPGGKDEDRLQVQVALPEPEKKYTDKAIQNQVIKRPSSTD